MRNFFPSKDQARIFQTTQAALSGALGFWKRLLITPCVGAPFFEQTRTTLADECHLYRQHLMAQTSSF